jgi:hypothetical protein
MPSEGVLPYKVVLQDIFLLIIDLTSKHKLKTNCFDAPAARIPIC